MLLTGSMIARTGLFAGLVVLALLLVYYASNHGTKSIFSTAIVSLLVLFAVDQILSDVKVSSFFADRFSRFIELSEESSEKGFLNARFFNNYLYSEQNYLPPITTETITGTGVPSGTSGNGIRVNIDGGFLRLYVAYGLILALFFYSFVLLNLFKTSLSFYTKIIKYTLLLTTLMFLIAEYKEWSFYGSPYILFFCVLAILASNNSIHINKKIINSNL